MGEGTKASLERTEGTAAATLAKDRRPQIQEVLSSEIRYCCHLGYSAQGQAQLRSDQVIEASLEGKGKLQHVPNFWKRPSKANLVMEFPNMRGRHGLLLFWLVQVYSFTFFNKSRHDLMVFEFS